MTLTQGLIPGDHVRTVNHGQPVTGTLVRKSHDGNTFLVDLDEGGDVWAGWDTCTRIEPVPASPVGFFAEKLRAAFAANPPGIAHPVFVVLACDFCGHPMGFIEEHSDGCDLFTACSAACRERLES